MKKIIMLCLVLVTIATFLSGCGDSPVEVFSDIYDHVEENNDDIEKAIEFLDEIGY